MLLLLQNKALRITDLARRMALNNPEIRRHVTRLKKAGLIKRDVEGLYHLTPFGELILRQLRELEFTSRHREYFIAHSLTNLPSNFISQISQLSLSVLTANIIDFFYGIETVIKEAEEFVWFNVDHYPVTLLSHIVKALEKGVEFRTIEHLETAIGPHLTFKAPDEAQTFNRLISTPLIEQKTLAKIDLILYLSEKKCMFAFPDANGMFDYRGFASTDMQALKWCRKVFTHYWNLAEPKVYIAPTKYVRPKETKALIKARPNSIVVEGHNNSTVDPQAVQDAVDFYDHVLLRGSFNFGSSKVRISKSVVIKGEGRENSIPATTIYKQGWRFPFTEFDAILEIHNEAADVTIENIHFTDFNHTCILGLQCNSLRIVNNRITLMTGYGRGESFGAFGDVVAGILVWGSELQVFKGKVTIEGNYIDLARGGAFAGFLTRGGLENDPEYRPDLLNHEYFMGFGIGVNHSSGNVLIENNIVRNTNARGIAITCNLPSSNVQIKNNTIISDVYGSYPFSSLEAGAGILTQSAWGFPSSGFKVDIIGNTIKFDKLNYSGIIVLGPVTDREGARKLSDGTISKNHVYLKKGYEGIHVRKCDKFKITDNTISGEAYYGIRISGRESDKIDLNARNNTVEGTKMRDLRIRAPDKYSNNHADERMFATHLKESTTSHVWLGANTKANIIKTMKKEVVIDQGEGNIVFAD
jgi:predicted transcriptional regulator